MNGRTGLRRIESSSVATCAALVTSSAKGAAAAAARALTTTPGAAAGRVSPPSSGPQALVAAVRGYTTFACVDIPILTPKINFRETFHILRNKTKRRTNCLR